MNNRPQVTIFWFRRDLRLEDNAGLHFALQQQWPVVPVFIFDKNILSALEDVYDKRINFIFNEINRLQQELSTCSTSIHILHINPLDAYKKLIEVYDIKLVVANHDYEPYAMERDNSIKSFLETKGIQLITKKDQVIFEKNEVLKDDGKPYTVFTPYSKKWKSVLQLNPVGSFKGATNHFFKAEKVEAFSLDQIGFKTVNAIYPVRHVADACIKNYAHNRDFPSLDATSHLSVHLRFGTISIRQLLEKSIGLSETYVNELIWREFYFTILWHFPHVVKNSFKPEYDAIKWRNNDTEFDAWCTGNTGYPIVDAGMRQLNETGFMHNRVRMIVASFLTKHLLIDWRWGEAYFAKKLLDFDLAANNGGWQWAAGCGCDAAPYFRIFNPYLQTKRFDAELKFIRKWVPEYESFTYPAPIVEHEYARKRCLQVYGEALKK